MSKIKMQDIVILIPGITGSVLQKDEKDLWAVSGQAIWSAIRSFGGSIEHLRVENDDIERDVLDDGITATRLISDVTFIPGLVKIDGYTKISEMIENNFDIIQGTPDGISPANYFEFPYDWRRDIRVAARKLKELVDVQLPRWREFSGAKDAKVILICHSMGGLVSRYYLENENLQGWKNCKSLITFGTPYRGSVKAVNFLANGLKPLFLDFTNVLRSMTSVYQLLPIYRSVKVGEEYKRVAEIENLPGINPTRAKSALKFHREIEKAVEENRKEEKYRDEGYELCPIVGTHQPSLQAAELIGDRVKVFKKVPDHFDSILNDGDGTVPMISAIPIELSNSYRETFFAESHASLQNNSKVLDLLRKRLAMMQVDLSDYRGGVKETADEEAAISIDLEDAYFDDEPVLIRGKLINTNSQGELKATIESVNGKGFREEYNFSEDSEGYFLKLEDLPEDLYRITTEAIKTEYSPPGVHDIFGVIKS